LAQQTSGAEPRQLGAVEAQSGRWQAKDRGLAVKRTISFLLGWLLFALLILAPAPAGMSRPAQQVAATVALMAAWWIGEALPLAATALVPLALLPLLGAAAATDVAHAYADPLIFLFLGGFFIAAAIEKWGLHRRIALGVLRVVGSSPSRIVLGFMLATAVLSMWISNTATAMMMYPIAIAVVKQRVRSHGIDLPEARRDEVERGFGLVVMLAVAYSASIGGTGTLIGTPPNVILAGQYEKLFPEAPPIGFAQWMLGAVPIVAISLLVCWADLVHVVAPRVVRKELGGRPAGRSGRLELEQLGKITKPERRVLILFLLTALLWVTRKNLEIGDFGIPGWSGLLPHPEYARDSTVAIVMGLLLFALPAGTSRDTRLLDWESVKSIPWGILILFGGGFAIAEAIGQSGLATWIGQRLAALDHVSPIVLVAVCCLVVTLLTEITSNTAVAAIFLPVVATVAGRLDIPPLLFMMPVTLAASFAFVLPVATPPNAIVMGSGWVTIAQMARAGLMLDLMGVVILVTVSFSLGALVF
jgi:sodium-dependent dicarboxylate transporter 2/3/5